VHDHTTRALTRSLVDLCRALDLEVVFEGVETEAEAAAVANFNGHYAQGYLFGRPMPIDDFAQALAAQTAVAVDS